MGRDGLSPRGTRHIIYMWLSVMNSHHKISTSQIETIIRLILDSHHAVLQNSRDAALLKNIRLHSPNQSSKGNTWLLECMPNVGVNVDLLIAHDKLSSLIFLPPNGNYMEHQQQAVSSYSKLCLITVVHDREPAAQWNSYHFIIPALRTIITWSGGSSWR